MKFVVLGNHCIGCGCYFKFVVEPRIKCKETCYVICMRKTKVNVKHVWISVCKCHLWQGMLSMSVVSWYEYFWLWNVEDLNILIWNADISNKEFLCTMQSLSLFHTYPHTHTHTQIVSRIKFQTMVSFDGLSVYVHVPICFLRQASSHRWYNKSINVPLISCFNLWGTS